MNLTQLIQNALQALKSNPMRSGLTMLGIVIGISSVILISSIGRGAVAFITEQLSVFGTGYFRIAPGSSPFSQVATTKNPLTTKDTQAVKNANISNVDLVAAIGFTNATVTGNDERVRATVRGAMPEALDILKPNIIEGRFLSNEDNSTSARVAVLGIDLSEELFGEGANPVGEGIRIDNARYRVIGLVEASSGISSNILNNSVLVPLESLINNITGVDEIFQMLVSVKNEEYLDQTIEDVEFFLRDYRDIKEDEDADFFTQSFKDSLETVQTITGLLTVMITGISAISLVVGGVGVMNIMLVTVTERTREIGLLKAIGAKDRDILIQFMIESVTLSLLGGIVGIFVGAFGAFMISLIVKIPFIISPIAVIFSVSISTFVGLIFGIYPARKAARLSPIDALRHE